MSTTIQYADYGDTIADLAMRDKQSNSQTMISAILLAVLLVITFFANLLLVATISASYKLRQNLLYLIFCQLGVLNLVDSVFVMFVSLLFLGNKNWVFGDALCRINTWAQQFFSLQTFFTILLMAVERALGLHRNGRLLLTRRYALCFSVLFGGVSVALASPTLFEGFPVTPYTYRYLCSVGANAPLPYTIVQLVVYGGCLFVITLCFGAVVRYNRTINDNRALPQYYDYGAFIMESRALQDYMTMHRLIVFIFVSFVFVQGPYLVLNFFIQIRNSEQLLLEIDELHVAQDVDTFLTFVMMLYPLLSTVLIFTTCSDIWCKLVNLVLCRRSAGIPYGSWMREQRADGKLNDSNGSDGVLTVVATTEGLQIRGRNGFILPQATQPQPPRPQPPAQPIVVHLPNSLPDTPSPEMRTRRVSAPKVVGRPGISGQAAQKPEAVARLAFESSSSSERSLKSKIPLSSRQLQEKRKRKVKWKADAAPKRTSATFVKRKSSK